MKRILVLSLLLLTACDMDRLNRVGRAPNFSDVDTYEEKILDDYQQAGFNDPIDRLSQAKEAHPPAPNSLWRPGSRTFFRDQRARSVGDILKVAVTVTEQAKMDNTNQVSRNDTTNLGVPNILGYEESFNRVLPQAVNPTSLAKINSADANSGKSSINRKETINTTVAATVVKILPNNNLVIRGSQEIRVNYEVREVTIDGIVRPEDIGADNSVTLDQVAEARVTYGGRGNVSDYMQPRYGKQILDAVLPF